MKSKGMLKAITTTANSRASSSNSCWLCRTSKLHTRYLLLCLHKARYSPYFHVVYLGGCDRWNRLHFWTGWQVLKQGQLYGGTRACHVGVDVEYGCSLARALDFVWQQWPERRFERVHSAVRWLSGWLAGWLVGLLVVGRSICWLVCRLDGWVVGWSVGWMFGWLIEWLISWSVCWLLIGLLVGWLICRLVGWLVGWSDGWLAGWLVGWLIGWSVDCFRCRRLCTSRPAQFWFLVLETEFAFLFCFVSFCICSCDLSFESYFVSYGVFFFFGFYLWWRVVFLLLVWLGFA